VNNRVKFIDIGIMKKSLLRQVLFLQIASCCEVLQAEKHK